MLTNENKNKRVKQYKINIFILTGTFLCRWYFKDCSWKKVQAEVILKSFCKEWRNRWTYSVSELKSGLCAWSNPYTSIMRSANFSVLSQPRSDVRERELASWYLQHAYSFFYACSKAEKRLLLLTELSTHACETKSFSATTTLK